MTRFLRVYEFNKSFYDLLEKFHDFLTGVVCNALCLCFLFECTDSPDGS